jgi:hypothetical protein
VTEARKDEAHISRTWEVSRDRIEGSVLHEVRNVVTANGLTTEI